MSRIIARSERDELLLRDILKKDIKRNVQPKDYRGKVVVKPWGYEFLAFENDLIAVWFLHIDRGQATSMHCHPKKKTGLVVLKGLALCNTLYNRNYLTGIDGVIIERGVFHSTQALSDGGIDLIEIETPPDKDDLVRMDDRYGRNGKGYEGLSDMKTIGLEQYGYFYFTGHEKEEAYESEVNRYCIKMFRIPENMETRQFVSSSKDCYYAPCSSGFVDRDGNTVLDVGEIASGDFLSAFNTLLAEKDSLILEFRKYKDENN